MHSNFSPALSNRVNVTLGLKFQFDLVAKREKSAKSCSKLFCGPFRKAFFEPEAFRSLQKPSRGLWKSFTGPSEASLQIAEAYNTKEKRWNIKIVKINADHVPQTGHWESLFGFETFRVFWKPSRYFHSLSLSKIKRTELAASRIENLFSQKSFKMMQKFILSSSWPKIFFAIAESFSYPESRAKIFVIWSPREKFCAKNA